MSKAILSALLFLIAVWLVGLVLFSNKGILMLSHKIIATQEATEKNKILKQDNKNLRSYVSEFTQNSDVMEGYVRRNLFLIAEGETFYYIDKAKFSKALKNNNELLQNYQLNPYNKKK